MRPQRKIIADQSALKCRHMATRDDQCTSGQMCTVRTSGTSTTATSACGMRHAAWGRGVAGRNWGIVRQPQGPVRSARYSYFFGQVGLKKCRHSNWCNPWHPRHQTTQGQEPKGIESSRVQQRGYCSDAVSIRTPASWFTCLRLALDLSTTEHGILYTAKPETSDGSILEIPFPLKSLSS